MQYQSISGITSHLRLHGRQSTTLVGRAAFQDYQNKPPIGVVGEPRAGLLLQYLAILRQHLGLLVLLSAAGMFAALLVGFLERPVYKARSSLEIQSVNENFLNLRDISPTNLSAGENGAYPPQYDLQTQVRILQSDAVLERVIAKLNLRSRLVEPTLLSRMARIRRTSHFPERTASSSRDNTLEALRKNLTISTEPNTRLVEIYFDSTDPALAADVINALTVEFIRQNIETRWKTTQQTGEWLSNQLESIRTKLEQSEDALEIYAHSSGLLFTSEKVGAQILEDNVAEEKLRQLQEQLSAAHGDRVARQSVFELASSAPPDSLPEVLDDKTLEDYHVKVTDLRRQLAELSTVLTASHPAVKKVQSQLNALESEVKKERSDDIQRIRDEYMSAYRRENLLSTNYRAQAQLVSEQAARVAHYNILKSDVDSSRQLYDSMLRDVEEAGMTSALNASNIRVVDVASPPSRPYKPNLLLDSLLGMFGGAFLGFGIVMLRERTDRSIQGPGEVKASLGIPELGVIPSLASEQGRFLASYRQWKMSHLFESKKAGYASRVELVTSHNGESVVADCFRAAATSVLYASESGTSQVIALTSANEQDGKTTVACNLALALVEIGSSVLLIDGDLRKGRLHEIFDIPNSWGLSELLSGVRPPDSRRQMYFDTCYEHLCVLPAGSKPSSVARLLHTRGAAELLRRARGKFDMIIIDTPPMLHIPDARVLGRLADGVILVVKSAETTLEEAGASAERLRQDDIRVFGTILNQWDPRKSTHSAYSYSYPHCRYDASVLEGS
jgi:polysaccharide biosynthesis transport protein